MIIDEKVYLRIFKDWAELVIKDKNANEKMTIRGSLEEGWMDIDIENEKYLAGALVNSENIYDLGAVDKGNGKVYDKMEFFTTPEQFKTDLDTFYSHFRASSLERFLIEISSNRKTTGT